MADRLIGLLNGRGVEVSKNHQGLIIEHFKKLPTRYAVAVKEASTEILMHISLLEEIRCKEGGRDIRHYLRNACANLPNGTVDETCETDSSSSSLEIKPRSAQAKAGNKHRIVSLTPTEESVLDSLTSDEERDETEIEDDVYGNKSERITKQDCYELTVAMTHKSDNLATVYGTLAQTGLDILESHGFTTTDSLFLYWFVLQDRKNSTSGQIRTLNSILNANFSTSPTRTSPPLAKREIFESLRDNCQEFKLVGECEKDKSSEGRRSSFLSLWTSDLDVEELSPAEWEIDPDQLQFLEKVGEGSWGSVLKGTYKGEVVAIKVIKNDSSDSPDWKSIKEFMQEISVLSKLKHERVVEFKGACMKASNICIVYEYMAKGNLRDLLRKKNCKLTPKRLLEYAIDIVTAMAYLSENRVIHRDIKATNILVSESGEVKVSDFGVAKLLRPSHYDNMTAETGTYRWMAPEVIEHKPYGYKADIYSFGILLWELISGGKTPYQLLSPVQAALGVANQGLRPDIPSNTPAYLRRIVKSCWETNPEDRPTLGELLDSLQESLRMIEDGRAQAKVAEPSPKHRTLSKFFSKILRT